MNSNWKEFILGESCTKIGSGATPTGGKETYLSEGEIALIRSQNVLDFEFSKDGLAYINKEQARKLNNVELEKDDVLINITGDSVARVCKVPDVLLPARVNQHVAILRTDRRKLDSDFLMYSLLMQSNKNLLLAIASAGGTRNALTKVMLEKFKITAPKEVTDQNRIANILKQLDSQITVNKKINQTLETIAQALFKSWFVDFDPVKAKIAAKEKGGDLQLAAMMAISGKTAEQIAQLPADKRKELAATADLFTEEMVDSELGEIPKGWKASNLTTVTTQIKRGITPKYIEDGGVMVLNQKCIRNHTINFESARRHNNTLKSVNDNCIKDGDILINSTGVGTLGRVAIIRRLLEKTTIDTHVTVVRADEKRINKIYLGINLLGRESEIESLAEGTTGQTELKRSLLGDLPLIIPQRNIQDIFAGILTPQLKMYAEREKENNALIQIRDSLLPKLLSGVVNP
ncbi:MAG: restriction endonuclease subunit S [Bacteroidota bacterium]|nr:restriction endonuclease subunit S [Bacteroidota bacterium]